jgi:hypothetical protein
MRLFLRRNATRIDIGISYLHKLMITQIKRQSSHIEVDSSGAYPGAASHDIPHNLNEPTVGTYNPEAMGIAF